MTGFLFRLQTADGVPAEPPTLTSAVPNWRPGDMIPLNSQRTFRVVDVRDDQADKELAPIVRSIFFRGSRKNSRKSSLRRC